jgi:hypothetical protein
MSPRASGCRDPCGGTGGAAGMWTLTWTVLAFLVVVAGVIALARSTTARWERDKRAARAPRPEVVAPPPSRGAAVWPWRTRTGAPARGPLEAVGQSLASTPQRVARGVHDAQRLWHALRRGGAGLRHPTGREALVRWVQAEDPSVDDAEVFEAAVNAPRPRRRAHRARRGLRTHTSGPGAGRAIPRLAQQLAQRVVHRHGGHRSDEHSGPAA